MDKAQGFTLGLAACVAALFCCSCNSKVPGPEAKAHGMNETTFWKIISSSKSEGLGDVDQQLKILHTKLATLSPEQVEGFDQAFAEYFRESDTWKLRAACSLINEGASDDWWDYFRAGLIMQGEGVYSRAAADPETLVDVVKFEEGKLTSESEWAAGVEEMLYVANDEFEKKTGRRIARRLEIDGKTKGEPWNVSEAELLPKLAEYCRSSRDRR